jgi:hypothetical protein
MIKASAKAFQAASEIGCVDRRAGLLNQARRETMAKNSRNLLKDSDQEDDALDQY